MRRHREGAMFPSLGTSAKAGLFWTFCRAVRRRQKDSAALIYTVERMTISIRRGRVIDLAGRTEPFSIGRPIRKYNRVYRGPHSRSAMMSNREMRREKKELCRSSSALDGDQP